MLVLFEMPGQQPTRGVQSGAASKFLHSCRQMTPALVKHSKLGSWHVPI